jgi:hypothetical protein
VTPPYFPYCFPTDGSDYVDVYPWAGVWSNNPEDYYVEYYDYSIYTYLDLGPWGHWQAYKFNASNNYRVFRPVLQRQVISYVMSDAAGNEATCEQTMARIGYQSPPAMNCPTSAELNFVLPYAGARARLGCTVNGTQFSAGCGNAMLAYTPAGISSFLRSPSYEYEFPAGKHAVVFEAVEDLTLALVLEPGDLTTDAMFQVTRTKCIVEFTVSEPETTTPTPEPEILTPYIPPPRAPRTHSLYGVHSFLCSSFYLSLTHTHTHAHSLFLSLSHSLTHTHTHSLSLSLLFLVLCCCFLI